jgi:histone-arginine methyltransferase CARM1
MLQDYIRTSTYKTAIENNRSDFEGKVVLDVGAGSGILSFFAAFAGARKVYAVEASNMAHCCRELVKNNGLDHIITVIQGKIEEIELPEEVDVIVSEPIGVLLVHERMCESYLYARDRWLKKNKDTSSLAIENGFQADTAPYNCRMFPSKGSIMLAPFSDAALYNETVHKAKFWSQKDVFGVNLSCLAGNGVDHYFSQPVVGVFDPNCLMSSPDCKWVDFLTVSMEELKTFSIPFSFISDYTGVVHGLGGWFDLSFEGSDQFISLSTSPYKPRTHWYQIRFMFATPLAINVGQVLTGEMFLKVNDKRSYDVEVKAWVETTGIGVHQHYQLHEQQYSYNVPSNQFETSAESFNLYTKL